MNYNASSNIVSVYLIIFVYNIRMDINTLTDNRAIIYNDS